MSAMTPERLAGIRERLDLYGGLDPLDTSDLLAEVERLRAGIEALHSCTTVFEACPSDGCDEDVCTEDVHNGGERYHADQPVNRVCLTCRHEDGEPHDWPCRTAYLLNPTEGES